MPPGHPSVTSIRCGVRWQSGDTALGRAERPRTLKSWIRLDLPRSAATVPPRPKTPDAKPHLPAPRLRAGYVKEPPLAFAIDATLPSTSKKSRYRVTKTRFFCRPGHFFIFIQLAASISAFRRSSFQDFWISALCFPDSCYSPGSPNPTDHRQ